MKRTFLPIILVFFLAGLLNCVKSDNQIKLVIKEGSDILF